MSSSKKIDFAVGVYLSEAQSPHIPPPLQTVCVYTVQIHTGKGGKCNQRDGERGNTGEYRSQSWVQNTNMTECTQEIDNLQSINFDQHLP
jgi:hypothetical protein